MILELDDFYQSAVRRQSTQDEPFRNQLLTIGVVELIAMAVPFTHFAHSVHFLCKRSLSEFAEVTPQTHGTALVADGTLI